MNLPVRTAPLPLPPRVLIVGNDRNDRLMLEGMLVSQPLQIRTADSGTEALAMVARESPDLILLDVMMPGLDGYQVAARIKADPATENIPIIMVSDLDDRPARLLGLNAGAEDVLSKPIDRAELCLRVRNLLRLKAYGDYHDTYYQILERQVHERSAALTESERLYRSAFDAAPVGLVHVGLDGRWLRVNQRLCDALGYSADELQRPAVQELVQRPDDAHQEAEWFRQLAAGTRDRHVIDEQRYRCRDGTDIWARVNMSVHRDTEGRCRYGIAVIDDITRRRTHEAQLRQAAKMDAIGRVTSGVAHEFNNLLTVIIGFAEIVIAGAPAASQNEDDLGEIIKAAGRAASLTRQLLAFGRRQVLPSAALDVNVLITQMIGTLGRLIGDDVEVTLELAPDLAPALADRGQLEQVLMSLVLNARDAMPQGGRVTIATAEAEPDNSSTHREADVSGNYVMLSITDTGPGMTAEARQRLFEPLFSIGNVGDRAGLALSTTYGIVKQSEGYISVDSEPGRGTTFKVYLPRSSDKAAATAPDPVAGVAAAGQWPTVLLVEDDPGTRQVAGRILDHAGYRVLEAANGDDAEKLFARHADSVDLVLTDMVMPVCGGRELSRRLRQRTPAVRLLYMSGCTEQSAVHQAGLDRHIPFVEKPFTAAELVTQVRNALDR
jgi:PAS domain S-box-containing protein